MSNLNGQVISGSVWGIAEKLSVQVVQLVVGVILTRLLEPRDYGLVAITIIFFGVISAITDAGFEKTLINQKDLEDIQISTVFYLGLGLGLLTSTVLFLSAPFISHLFKDDALTPVVRVVSVTLLINSLGQTQRTLLLRHFKFKQLSITQVVSSVVSGIAGIAMALNHFGVFSLVYMTLISYTISLLLFWLQSTWRPGLQFSIASIRGMIPYGSKILLSSIFFYVNTQLTTIAVGRTNDKSQLGFFSRGSTFPLLLSATIQGVVLKMAFPVFSRLKDETDNIVYVFGRILKSMLFVLFICIIILFCCAEDLTIYLFTSKWQGSVVYLEIFCMISIFEMISTLYRELLLARGHSALISKLLAGAFVANAVLCLLLIQQGLIVLLVGILMSTVSQAYLYMLFFSQKMKVTVVEQLRWLAPYILMLITTTAVVKAAEYFLFPDALSLLTSIILKGIISIALYVLLAFLLRIRELKMFYGLSLAYANKLRPKQNPFL